MPCVAAGNEFRLIPAAESWDMKLLKQRFDGLPPALPFGGKACMLLLFVGTWLIMPELLVAYWLLTMGSIGCP